MFIRFTTLICFCAFAIYWFHIRMRPEDVIAYNKLIQESTELRTRHALEETPAHQKRQGVQKDIWSQNETRHFRIQSEHSELTLSQKKDKIEVLEQLQDIRCTTTDDCILTAEVGVYTFPSHQFTAQKNCHLVQQGNEITGNKIHVDLEREIFTYENPKGHLIAGPIDFKAEKLIWYKREGKLLLNNHVIIEQPGEFTLTADQGTLSLDKFHPLLLVLDGNVRLISSKIQEKESYAIADSLTYDPLTKTLLFSADRRVLFWQEGLTLSAEEVLIRKDQSVEGHGDVHFTFDLEEQNFIDKLFKPYL